jgi:hypothetical protein
MSTLYERLLLITIWGAAMTWLSRNPSAPNWSEVASNIKKLGGIPDLY